jgi:hypothetical protein
MKQGIKCAVLNYDAWEDIREVAAEVLYMM